MIIVQKKKKKKSISTYFVLFFLFRLHVYYVKCILLMLLNKKKKYICPFNLFEVKLSSFRKSVITFYLKMKIFIILASKMKLQVSSKNFINV